MTDAASRVDRIKRYLDEHRAEIEAAPSGSLVIDYNGPETTIKRGIVDRLRNGNGHPPTAVMD